MKVYCLMAKNPEGTPVIIKVFKSKIMVSDYLTELIMFDRDLYNIRQVLYEEEKELLE